MLSRTDLQTIRRFIEDAKAMRAPTLVVVGGKDGNAPPLVDAICSMCRPCSRQPTFTAFKMVGECTKLDYVLWWPRARGKGSVLARMAREDGFKGGLIWYQKHAPTCGQVLHAPGNAISLNLPLLFRLSDSMMEAGKEVHDDAHGSASVSGLDSP